MEQPRERGKNFTEKEKEVALEIIDRYRPILEDKKTDGTSTKQRKATWEKIEDEFNATSVSGSRTVKQLKILWSNLRRVARKTVAEENKKRYLDEIDNVDIDSAKKKKVEDKKNISKTGGGQYRAQLTEVGARVLAMVEPEARPLPNIYDDDSWYHGGSTSISSGTTTPGSTAGSSSFAKIAMLCKTQQATMMDALCLPQYLVGFVEIDLLENITVFIAATDVHAFLKEVFGEILFTLAFLEMDVASLTKLEETGVLTADCNDVSQFK